ncbi:MAG: aminotransferase class I/II-fold pyridoxal phosphate-dependent enzyme [Bacilli bacterium]|nr:aminotransferase class I/II-fold pyridoxal phosphate-dependent enzyme [Bacilli bacterium]
MKYQFRNDYSVLGHEKVLKALYDHRNEQNVGYGLDNHSFEAAKLIKVKFDCNDADVHFLAGGTQTNMVFISSALRPYEAVIACKTGHINVHETGSVEGSGHKIFIVEGRNGKIYPEEIEKAINYNCDEHMVKIKMVYISNSTEIGTIYKAQELKDLRKICDKYGLYLFIDGARLGSALTAKDNDVTPELIGEVADAFYVGGTKNGLLYGEALVIVNKDLQKDFRYHLKNKGAMLSKGFSLGIQFETIMKDGLYFDLAKHANEVAYLLAEGLIKLNVQILPFETNQIFATFNKNDALDLIETYGCEKWIDLGDKITIRFVTSFNTKEEDVKELLNYIKVLLNK